MAKESVIEKFRDGLSPEQFTELEESIKTLVEDKAKVRAELLIEEEKNRLEELAEEFCEKEVNARLEDAKKTLEESYNQKISEFKKVTTEKLEEISENYCELKIKEEVSKKVVQLEEAYESKIQKLEENVLDQLDKFIDAEISEKISDDLLSEIAINEAYKPVIAGIQALFEGNLVGLDSDGSKKIKELEAKNKEISDKLNEAYEEKIKVHEKNDKLKSALLISSKCDGLTNTQKNRVISMFEGKSYDEVNSKIGDFISLLEEKEELFEKDDVLNEEIFSGLDDGLLEEDEKVVEKKSEKTENEFGFDMGRVLRNL